MKGGITYPVNEAFYTFQGEGAHMGKAAFFVRLHGCPVKCPWCDSAGTWHHKFVPEDIARLTAREIIRLKPSGANRIVITGGEPCIHDLTSLVAVAQASGCIVAVETCGAFPVVRELDWITVSPKWNKLPLRESLRMAHELKLIINDASDIVAWENKLEEIMGHSLQVQQELTGLDVWLHPQWGNRANSGVLKFISDAVLANPKLYRAGWQIHKEYMVDMMVEGSRKEIIPLGGKAQ